MTAETSNTDRSVEPPEDFVRRAAGRGWPEGLLQRALDLRINRGDIDFWLKNKRQKIERIQRYLDDRELLMSGTLRVREATWSDDEGVAELYADSPEEIGDFEVTVERSPYPYAQFRLQEHVNIQILEDR